MMASLAQLLRFIWSTFRSQAAVAAENLVLRQQLIVLGRKAPKRVRLTNFDRLLFVWTSRLFPSVVDAFRIVRPETVIRWQRTGFRAYWRWKSRSAGGRPAIDPKVRELIREMSLANPLWGAPRIQAELRLLGHEGAKSTVAKYMVRERKPESVWIT